MQSLDAAQTLQLQEHEEGKDKRRWIEKVYCHHKALEGEKKKPKTDGRLWQRLEAGSFSIHILFTASVIGFIMTSEQ